MVRRSILVDPARAVNMLDLKYKQRIRDFIDGKMAHERQQSRVFRTTPAVIIRDDEMEQFIDDLWVHLNDVPTHVPSVTDPMQGMPEAPSAEERERNSETKNEDTVH